MRDALSLVPAWPILAGLLAAPGCGPTLPRPDDLPVEAGQVFAGPDGLELAVLWLRPRSDGRMLLRVRGSGSDFDDKVLPCEHEERSSDRRAWSTRYRGRDFYPLHQSPNGAGSSWEVYLPGRRGPLVVAPDDGRSKALSPSELVATHRRQATDGVLAAFARFDRPREVAEQEEALAGDIEAMRKACGGDIAGRVDWDSVPDGFMLEKSVSGWCEGLFDAARHLCERSAEARASLSGAVKELLCRLGPGGPKLEVGERGRVAFTLPEANVSEAARAAFRGAFEEDGPGGARLTLGRRIDIEGTALCTDGKAHYVVSAPHPQGRRLAYGDGKRFAEIPTPGGRVPAGMFLDPRNYNPKLNSNFWGIDLRPYSLVDVDEKTGACKVACGAREVSLPAVPAAERKQVLVGATFEPPPKRRVPEALARDTRGVYYLVDRSDAPDARDFRLYIGPKGALKLQAMTNVVSDSEGEVFTTKSGSLRFVVGRAEATWIARRKATKLTLVPIAENLPMIWNELGVYDGRLGTPCDDF